MSDTAMRRMHSAKQEDIFSYQTMKNSQFPPNNSAILTNATIIKVVMSSAAKAKLGAFFKMPRKRYTLVKYYPKWDIFSHGCQSKQTT
jgi:hypothetical protein